MGTEEKTSEALRILFGADDAEPELSSHEIMKNLDDKQADRFVKFQDLFESDGWKIVVELAQARAFVEGVTGANAKTWEENRVALGKRLVWDEIAGMEKQVMNEFQAAALQNAADAEEAIQDDLDNE